MNTAEQNAFIDSFMNSNGAGLRENDVRRFVEFFDKLETEDLFFLYGKEFCSTVIDALLIWQNAVYFTKQQALEALGLK